MAYSPEGSAARNLDFEVGEDKWDYLDGDAANTDREYTGPQLVVENAITKAAREAKARLTARSALQEDQQPAEPNKYAAMRGQSALSSNSELESTLKSLKAAAEAGTDPAATLRYLATLKTHQAGLDAKNEAGLLSELEIRQKFELGERINHAERMVVGNKSLDNPSNSNTMSETMALGILTGLQTLQDSQSRIQARLSGGQTATENNPLLRISTDNRGRPSAVVDSGLLADWVLQKFGRESMPMVAQIKRGNCDLNHLVQSVTGYLRHNAMHLSQGGGFNSVAAHLAGAHQVRPSHVAEASKVTETLGGMSPLPGQNGPKIDYAVTSFRADRLAGKISEPKAPAAPEKASLWSRAMNKVGNIAEGAGKAISNITNSIGNSVRSVMNSAINTYEKVAQKAAPTVASVTEKVQSKVSSVMSRFGNWMTGKGSPVQEAYAF